MKDQIYIVTETYEGDNGIREFDILLATFKKSKALALLQSKKEEDEYGFFEKNGFEEDSESEISSNYNEGFVSYAIQEKKVE